MSATPDPVCRILISYWYWQKRDVAALTRMTDLPVRLFADSGAYSAHTLRGGGGTIRREDYAAWLKDHRQHLTIMANLDSIGDPRKTAQNQLWLEERGLPVLPVFHGSSPLSELEALCRDYKYIALGGTAALHGRSALLAFTARCALIAREHGTVLHGFGRSSSKDLTAIPFYSVDSSTWMQGARFGHLQLFDGQQIRQLGVAQAVKHPQLVRAHGADPQRMCRADYANQGRKFGKLRPVDEYRREKHESLFVAAVAWKRFEAYLRQRHHVAPPPGQEDMGTTVWFADDVIRHHQQMMRAVQWLADGAKREAI
jgi:hypothetical protein